MKYFLAADVGGTKTDLTLFSSERGYGSPLHEETLASNKFSSFTELLHSFLADQDISIHGACFGVAGPVRDNRVKLTNLPWEIDGKEVGAEFAINHVHVINDLVAIASSIPHLTDDDLVVLAAGKKSDQGAIGVVAPGTGLGVAYAVRNKDGYLVCPSEGGHAGFSPGNEIERDLLAYMQAKGEHVSFESLCSGMGLPNIYRFLMDSDRFVESDFLQEQFSSGKDMTPLIVQNALDSKNRSELCLETVRLFVQILAEACSNLSVTFFATGGIYLGGGMPVRILPFLQHDFFLKRFRAKGKMSALLHDIGVSVIVNPKAALLGAAVTAMTKGEER